MAWGDFWLVVVGNIAKTLNIRLLPLQFPRTILRLLSEWKQKKTIVIWQRDHKNSPT